MEAFQRSNEYQEKYNKANADLKQRINFQTQLYKHKEANSKA